MALLSKLRTKLTGKTDLERKQEKRALKEIKKDVNDARFKTKREEAVKYAIEVEKERYKRMLEKVKQHKQVFQKNMQFGTSLGKPRGSMVASGKRFNVMTGRWE